MTMPLSGPISLFDCNDEFGHAHAGPVALQDGQVLSLAGLSGPAIGLFDLYGKSTVTNYAWSVPGTYTIPGEPGKSSATITIAAGGGGGGGGGHGGDGDSTGAGGGGAGGGGGGGTLHGVIHFPVGTGLTVVVGDGGAGGQRGIGWASVDGTWMVGNNGSVGGQGHATYIYDVNGNLLAVIDGGLGGGGGHGGMRTNTDFAAGGTGGSGTPAGSDGASNASSTMGGAGGAGGGNGGHGGAGGNGVGYTGEDGDSGLRQEGLDGNAGAGGSASVAFGAVEAGAPDIVATQLSASLTAANYTSSPADVPVTILGGVKPYSVSWNVSNNNGLNVTNLNQQYCTISGTTGDVDLSCTVTDAAGRSTTSNTANFTMDDQTACVAVESFLPVGNIAGDIVVGSMMELGDEQTFASSFGVVSYSHREFVRGYRIQTSSGASLRCSATAPIPTPDGLVLAPSLLGQLVPVMHRDAANDVRGWEEVVSVEDIGYIEVQHITVGDKCFWAGEQMGAFILHHNMKALP